MYILVISSLLTLIIDDKSKNKAQKLEIFTINSEIINESILSLHKIDIFEPKALIINNKLDNKKIGTQDIELGIYNKLFTHYEFYASQTTDQLRTEIRNQKYLSKSHINNTTYSTALINLGTTKKARYISILPVNQDERILYAQPSPTPTLMAIYINEERDKLWSLHKIDRSRWNVTANSEQAEVIGGYEGPATKIVDGDVRTIWHSMYNNLGNGHDDRPSVNDPFQITIDFGEDTVFKAFSYMPRQAGDINGLFRHYEFYAAQTQDELVSLINSNKFLVKGDIDPLIRFSTLVIFYEQIKTPLSIPSQELTREIFEGKAKENGLEISK